VATIQIGIIGAGPRGLTVLERIVANERTRQSAPVEILLFDPNEPGVGCHDPEQAEFLSVNTVAGQITQFSDASVVGAGPAMEGPSFYQWLQDEPRIGRAAADRGATVSADAYYSRSLFGRYLHWVFHYLCALAPAHVKVRFIRAAVTRAECGTDDTWVLSTPVGAFRANYLFLTTGHSKPAQAKAGKAGSAAQTKLASARRQATTVVSDPYPIKEKLSFVEPGMTVAIEGMGLTACDVLAELTVGRGGRFVASSPNGEKGEKQYIPSGKEPRIIALSRSGLPLTARAVNQKGVSVQYQPRFLFAQKLRELRAVRKLDFNRDVMPLLLADMQYAYYEALLRERRDPVASMLFCNQFICADLARREALVEKYIPAKDRFSWDSLVAPVPDAALATRTEFRAWLATYLRQDLAEANKGNLDSPVKAASDVLRDLRDTLRAAIDFGGLSEASHRWLLSEFAPVMNRIAVGPPPTRIAEMLALMQAGVLEADWGPGAACERSASSRGLLQVASAKWPEHKADVHALIKARVSMPSPKDDASPLMRGLLYAGYVRPFHNGNFHPGGIEINRDFNWVSRRGQAVGNAWALGIPTEGIKFYTFVVPRSGVNSTALVDAGRAVSKMLSLINRQPAVRSPVVASPLPTEEDASAFASMHGAFS
jgi:uncharacterized NAD(P)/FAD-binding protein YdhS